MGSDLQLTNTGLRRLPTSEGYSRVNSCSWENLWKHYVFDRSLYQNEHELHVKEVLGLVVLFKTEPEPVGRSYGAPG